MLFFNKSQKNNIENRTIILRHFPEPEEIQQMDFLKKLIWLKLDDIKFSRSGNIITISREQAEQSSIMDIVSFISDMSFDRNIEKIIYTVKNKMLDIVVTLWEECVIFYKEIIDLNGNKQLKPSGKIKSVIMIDDKKTGKYYFSNNGEKDETIDTVNGIEFPSSYILKNGITVLRQLEFDGTLPKSVLFKEQNGVPEYLTDQSRQKDINDKAFLKEITIYLKDASVASFTVDSLYTSNESLQRIGSYFKMNEHLRLDISDKSNENGKVLTIRKSFDIYSIGIIDEFNNTVYYYNNGDDKGGYTEIAGETYPDFMISNDSDLVYAVIENFLQTGEPLEKVEWIIEEI